MSHKHTFLPSIIALIVLLSFPVLMHAQANGQVIIPAADADTTAVISFEELSYDFGEITEGDVVTHVFTLTNTGSIPLVLKSVKGSCGCTVPKWPMEPIWPGETSSFTVMFDSKGKTGKQSKRVTVTANTDPPFHFLTVTGTVHGREQDGNAQVTEPEAADPLPADCFMIYPNPTTSSVSIRIAPEYTGQEVTVSIFSDNGQTMASRATDNTQDDITFTVDHYPAGNYFAKVQIDGKVIETRCFVVTK